MPLIRVNRESVDDRFSVLGFTVRTESPLAEVAIATDPALFEAPNRARRNRRNFYSSRSTGALRARRGELTYLVPPDVLSNFVGQQRLYFGLATYGDNSGGIPDAVQAPSGGHMYVDLSGLTERGLRRFVGRPARGGAYGADNSAGDASLGWGGDALPQAAARAEQQPAATTKSASKSTAPVAYDDGFGAFPKAAEPPSTASPGPAAAAVAAPPKASAAPAGETPTKAQALGRSRAFNADGADDAYDADADNHGIQGPIPYDDDDTITPVAQAQAARSARTLDAPQPDYPGASRFAAAARGNYRARSSPRTIDRIVIHITDGGNRIDGTIAWFQNPDQRNSRDEHISVSAHYVVGQDGQVVQMVRDNDIAWHASAVNGRSIGIEHIAHQRRAARKGRAEVPALPPSQAQYEASAGLVAWLCAQHGIPVDREHILGHFEASPRDDHDCPSALWDWDSYMACVSQAVAALAPSAPAAAQALGRGARPVTRRTPAPAAARAQEIITPFYDPADPASALQCQAGAFSQAREEWFAGVPDTTLFPHSAICLLEMKDGGGAVSGYGTGFYIGARRILTCGHNLQGAASVDVIPACNDNAEPYGRFNVTPANWRIPTRYDGSGHYDIAVIDDVPCEAPNGRWFDALEELNQSRPEGVVVCGYSRKSDRVPELTSAMNGRMQHLHAGYIAQLRGEVFDYPILTLHRASGSPVYYISDKEGGALKAYVVGVHISGEIAQTQNLNTGCRLTDTKIGWIERRPGAQALADACYSIHWDTVPYYTQQTDASCWAAAAAMVVAWRDGVTIDDADIAAKVPALDAYRNGLWPSDRHRLADVWGLVPEPPACYTLDAWRGMLQDYGPLWLDMTNSVGTGGHAWVLVGMTSDGAPDGSDTVMYLHNPSPSRGKVKWKFPDFQRLYEGRVGTEGATLDCQILHAAGVPGALRPTTAAPFTLGLAVDTDVPRPRPWRAPQAQGRPTPQARPRALGDDVIDYPVELVPQPNKQACWAAAMAMLLSYRRQASTTPETLAAEVGGSLLSSCGWDLLDAVRQRYGFQAIDLPSNASLYLSPVQWAQWLRDLGPLWVVIVGLPHAVVVSGLRGDTADTKACQLRLLNPWDTRVGFDSDPVDFHPANHGYADWIAFEQFASDFGNMAEPDHGNWRVLHLPAQGTQAAKAPSLGAARPAQGPRLTPPPRPVRALALDATAATAATGDEPIEPSRVNGTTMRRRRGSRGRVTWALDQLDGVKLPDPAAAMVPALLPTTVALDQWPCLAGDAVPLPLTVRFDAGGGAVGNIRIAAGPPADLAYDVSVTATIDDDPGAPPMPPMPSTQAMPSNQAALRVTVDIDFNGTAGGDASARIALRLVGNGRYDMDSRWL